MMSMKVVELLLPTFLMDESMRPMILTSSFMGVCAIVLFTVIKLRSSSYNLANGISVNTKVSLKEFLYAIYEDNDSQQRSKGLKETDII